MHTHADAGLADQLAVTTAVHGCTPGRTPLYTPSILYMQVRGSRSWENVTEDTKAEGCGVALKHRGGLASAADIVSGCLARRGTGDTLIDLPGVPARRGDRYGSRRGF